MVAVEWISALGTYLAAIAGGRWRSLANAALEVPSSGGKTKRKE
jgi:hypothetical protein